MVITWTGADITLSAGLLLNNIMDQYCRIMHNRMNMHTTLTAFVGIYV